MSGHTGPQPDPRDTHAHNGFEPSFIDLPHVRSFTVSHLQLDQLAMLRHREACSQARQARLVRLARGVSRSSRAARLDAPAPVAQPRLVPAPR